ncbi:MAG: hypothetical protein ACYDA3_09670 [Gaiellaceae bacterium]
MSTVVLKFVASFADAVTAQASRRRPEMMKKLLPLAAVAALAAGLGGTAARAGADPVAAVQADVQKLVTDATLLHSTIEADAQKISADVQALQGTTTKATVQATLKADWQKVQADRAQLWPPVQADWAQLKTDVAAAHAAKAGKGQLKPLLVQANQALAQQRAAVKQALDAAHQAAQALRQSLKKGK